METMTGMEAVTRWVEGDHLEYRDPKGDWQTMLPILASRSVPDFSVPNRQYRVARKETYRLYANSTFFGMWDITVLKAGVRDSEKTEALLRAMEEILK